MTPAPPPVDGHSGRPLVQKLGVRPGHRVALVHAPPDLAHALAPLPADVTVVAGDDPSARADVVLLFATRADALAADFPIAAAALARGALLWIAWPKQAARRAAGIATDLTEDVVRGVGLATGLVDVKVCAVDAVWSGLEFVHRRRTG